MFTQAINFYRFFCDILKYSCLENVIPQLDKNEWLLLSAFQHGLRQKLVFSEHMKMRFLTGFILKPTEGAKFF